MQRIDNLYPEVIYDADKGGMFPELRAMVQEQQSRSSSANTETGFEMKQSTMPDHVEQTEKLFSNVRPALVVAEGETEEGVPDPVIAQYAFGSLADLKIQMSNTFPDQFVSKYMPCIFLGP